VWIALVEFLLGVFEEWGFSTRIFQYLLEGEFSVSNARSVLADTVVQAIWEKPIFGHGLMGDRVVTGGYYAHNILLEFLCHYGVFIGSFLLVAAFMIPTVATFRSRKKESFHFLLMMTCLVFIKLMMSGSYLLEADFFLLLGLCVCVLREKETAK
jgi:O-antigen ligase